MAPDRIAVQYTAAATSGPDVVSAVHDSCHGSYSCVICIHHLLKLIGSCFTRDPPGSTERYTRWCNTLSQSQLHTQVT